MLQAVIWILVICGGAALLYWAVDKLATPDPLNRIVKVLAICVAIILVVMIILNLLGLSATPPGLS